MATSNAARYRTADYERHLHSAKWRATRSSVLARDNYRCCRCNNPATEVHHRTYERLGYEHVDDLESLCPSCHEIADQERAQVSARRAKKALRRARINGWATKRYGEDWDTYGDAQEIGNEFDDWLASREYD